MEGQTRLDVHRALALSLFEAGRVTLAQGAKLADLSLEGFIELLGQTGITVVSYPAEDLADELEAAWTDPPESSAP